jgi:hypothetical protein
VPQKAKLENRRNNRHLDGQTVNYTSILYSYPMIFSTLTQRPNEKLRLPQNNRAPQFHCMVMLHLANKDREVLSLSGVPYLIKVNMKVKKIFKKLNYLLLLIYKHSKTTIQQYLCYSIYGLIQVQNLLYGNPSWISQIFGSRS